MKKYFFDYDYYYTNSVLPNGNMIYYETDDFITGNNWYFSFYNPSTEEVYLLDDFSTTSTLSEEEYFQRSLLWDNTSLDVTFDEYIKIQNFLKLLVSQTNMPPNNYVDFGTIWI